MRAIAICSLLVLISVSVAGAQDVERPSHWPSAAEVIKSILAGERGVPMATALTKCPDQNPYGDTVWTALLVPTPTLDMALRLAPLFSHALVKCGDVRVAGWYRARILEAEDVLSVDHFLIPLRGHGTPETIEFLEELAVDPSRSEQVRGHILHVLARGADLERRKDLYLAALTSPPAIPHPYARNESWFLVNSPVGEAFVFEALDRMAAGRGGSGAPGLLADLSVYQPVLDSAAMRGQLLRTAVLIIDRGVGYPDELVESARLVRDNLNEVP